MDQIEPVAIRRDRVEAEVTLERHRPARSEAPAENQEECLRTRERLPRLDQRERLPVCREPAG
jgi:hypothetical protein